MKIINQTESGRQATADEPGNGSEKKALRANKSKAAAVPRGPRWLPFTGLWVAAHELRVVPSARRVKQPVRKEFTRDMKIVTQENLLAITHALLARIGTDRFSARLLPGKALTRTLRITSASRRAVERVAQAVREAAATALALLLALPLLGAQVEIALGTVLAMWSGTLLVFVVIFFIRAWRHGKAMDRRNRKYFEP